MAENMNVDSVVLSSGNVIDCEYAVHTMGKLFQEDNLRDIKLIAGVDGQT